ncbi:succinylglutamate desuccinylase/aspartoacylase domain-containing protein [Pseudoalteromonas sp. PPB1]|uniref:succinylglutamate desuccinylase/aspartoacylase domain-containing protein n=1 Tax=Pseudoalteromonas sp. PPB1 TaxID=2756136 RepID=UPI001891D79B|nr:succinylglutamate desuccinylase/aspartoacylase family protein [Pseudoalteromonas sp. PPB1]
MDKQVEQALARFSAFRSAKTLGNFSVEQIDEWGFTLVPKGSESEDGSFHSDLTLIALNHGNEVGGLAVLNALCQEIDNGQLTPDLRITFLLGNVAAAKAGKRYLEQDINRTFNTQAHDSLESQRAKQLEPIVRNSRFILDFHQTIEPTNTPFFVYQYNRLAALFAHAVDNALPVITHKQSIASTLGGMRCDEFGTHCGCVSIALELSQKGFDQQGIKLGILAAKRAVAAVENWTEVKSQAPKQVNPMWTWSHIEAYPQEYVQLHAGLQNFTEVEVGQLLGHTQLGIAVQAAQSGALLFPKHIKVGEPKPGELYRILKQVNYFATSGPGRAVA